MFLKTEDGEEHKFISATVIHAVAIEEEVTVARSLWTGKIQFVTSGDTVHTLHLFERLFVYGLLALFAIIVLGTIGGAVSSANDGKPSPPLRSLGAAVTLLVIAALAVTIGFLWETRW